MNLRSVIFAFFFSFLSIIAYAEDLKCPQQHCVMIIDGGSTGSRAHLYSYDLNAMNFPVNIHDQWQKKVVPGLATIELNSTDMDDYLTALLAKAPISEVPVLFYTTAGMRLLPELKQQQTYALVEDWFKNHPNWQLKEVKTITGSEEAIYGWLAVNYQLGALESKVSPVGVMDMGGASVQIVFPVKNVEGIAESDLQSIKVNGHSYRLFAHSFLGLGRTEVTHQFLDSTACFSHNYPTPSNQLAMGDIYACESEIAVLTNTIHKVNSTVQPALSSNPVSSWYVLGGLVYLVESDPIHLSTSSFTSQELLGKANEQVCQQQWSVLNQKYPNDENLYGYCLSSAYYVALINEGYGISSQENLNYLNAKANDWTMGALIFRPI